ncbi:DNA-binding protein, partial [Xylella fastidiosa subsp. multiplex]|nr:DNA-binding protein [Xylella fastidiosa subsp. multiplex]
MSTTEKLPVLYGEGEATRRLCISKTTLTRERIAGRIHPIGISTRIYRYSNQILEEYIQQCRNVVEKSGII